MAKPARYAKLSPYGDDPRDLDQDVHDISLTAGERSVPLPRGSAGRSLRLIALLLIAVAGGWAYFGDPSTWPGRIEREWAAFNAGAERQPAAPAPTAVAQPAVEPPSLPTQTSSIATSAMQQLPVAMVEKPAIVPETPPAKSTTSDTATEQPPVEKAPPEPLPEVVATEPYQRRAVAAGLHPELSRALLEKLTTADYRNASQAIRTALAETPDSEVYTWPQQPKRGLAVFQVRFVEGAPADCRRYVVAIGKDGWSTTALPMEKCGIKPKRSAAGQAPVTQGAGNKALVRPINQ